MLVHPSLTEGGSHRAAPAAPPSGARASAAHHHARARRRREAELALWARDVLRGAGAYRREVRPA
jgi:hypothetical protein